MLTVFKRNWTWNFSRSARWLARIVLAMIYTILIFSPLYCVYLGVVSVKRPRHTFAARSEKFRLMGSELWTNVSDENRFDMSTGFIRLPVTVAGAIFLANFRLANRTTSMGRRALPNCNNKMMLAIRESVRAQSTKRRRTICGKRPQQTHTQNLVNLERPKRKIVPIVWFIIAK